jgi:hypothetical protein
MRNRQSTWRASRTVVAILLCMACAAAGAQGVQVSVVGGSPRYLSVPPGGATTFSFEVRNFGPVAADFAIGGELQVPAATLAAYAFAPREPALCGAPVLEQRNGYNAIRFPLATLEAGGARTCEYAVQRAAGPAGDLGFQACWLPGAIPNDFCGTRVRLGTLPDLDLVLETLGAGSGDTTLLRLRLHNRSAIDVESRVASTFCHEFDGGWVVPTQFDVDGNIAGGCQSTHGAYCLNFTGVYSVSRAFRLGPVPAGASYSCLLRVRRMRPNGDAQVPLQLVDDYVGLPGGATGFDPRRDGERVLIGLGLPGAVPVPLGPATPVAIALAVLLAGLLALRRRGGLAQSA